jgi:hypothetical protein
MEERADAPWMLAVHRLNERKPFLCSDDSASAAEHSPKWYQIEQGFSVLPIR